MPAQILIITGSCILDVLGLMYFIYVLATDKSNAHNHETTTATKKTSLHITKQTSM